MKKQRPYDPDTLLIALKQREMRSNSTLPPKGICGAIIGSLNTACEGKPNRDKLLFHLFDITTSKELVPEQWFALSEWVKVFKSDNPPPAWGYSKYLNIECKLILDSIEYNYMTEEEKIAEMKSRVLANATRFRSPMTQLPISDFDEWERNRKSVKEN